jgi:hypothetical protein
MIMWRKAVKMRMRTVWVVCLLTCFAAGMTYTLTVLHGTVINHADDGYNWNINVPKHSTRIADKREREKNTRTPTDIHKITHSLPAAPVKVLHKDKDGWHVR